MVPDATMGWNSPQLPQKWRGAAWLTALLLCLSAIQLPRCDAEGEFAANSAETCAAEEPEGTLIFQPASVSCVPCGANESAAADGLACECADGHRIVRTTPSLACERCPDDQVVSLDGFGCERCDANLTIFEDGATCLSCRGNAVIASTGVGTPVPIRTCITCADGWMRDPGTVIPVQCVRCPDPLMQPVGDNPCACPASYVAAAGHCVRRAGERLVGLVDFPDTGLEIESVVVEELLLKAAALCSDSVRNATQCQVLANLCALQLFASTAEACIQHRALAATSVGIDPVHGWDAWPQGLPWLEYDSIADLSRYRDDLDLVVTRNEGTTGGGGPTKLQFVAATYTLEGGFLGFRDLSPELQFCERPQNALGAWTAFGNNVVNTCELDLATGFAGQPASPLFFEPYLVSGPSGNLYPVPVIIDAAGRDGVAVRRFFTYDNVTADSGGGELKAVRVMTTAKLSIVLRDTEGHIEPPQLHVTYGDFGWPPAAAASVTLTFTAEYSQDQSSYRRSVTIATFVFLGLAFLVALVSQMSWRSRNERRELWGQVLFLYHWAGAFSTLLFWLLFGSSLYWLVFINGQTTVYLVVPTATQDVLFETLIITAMTLKLFEVLVLIHRQTSVDVFLIDWERPKGRLANAAETSTEDTVSIWRTYFVANEWNEIQMERKVKPVFLLLSVLFFQYATDIGSPKDTVSGSEHNLFRFAWTSILFISLGAAQWVFYVFFYSRFIEDPLGQFTDLCSMANVSVMVLEDSFHGYYIHGRSPHGYSDTDMWELRNHLRKEGEDLTGRRGLEENSDQQTFEIFVPPRLRQEWDGVLLKLLEEEATSDGKIGGRDGGMTDRALHAYDTVNRFLAAFIDHSFPDLDYSVQASRLLDGVFKLTPDFSTRGVFLNDSANSFATTLFFGHDATLCMLDALMFGVVDAYTTNFAVAGTVTYLVSRILSGWRASRGRRNIAAKTLVDSRFLV